MTSRIAPLALHCWPRTWLRTKIGVASDKPLAIFVPGATADLIRVHPSLSADAAQEVMFLAKDPVTGRIEERGRRMQMTLYNLGTGPPITRVADNAEVAFNEVETVRINACLYKKALQDQQWSMVEFPRQAVRRVQPAIVLSVVCSHASRSLSSWLNAILSSHVSVRGLLTASSGIRSRYSPTIESGFDDVCVRR